MDPVTVSHAYADERIHEKIATFTRPRERHGLWTLDAKLRAAGAPPGLRLHLVSAVAQLGRIGRESLPGRMARAAAPQAWRG